jgi:hypothetical protein
MIAGTGCWHSSTFIQGTYIVDKDYQCKLLDILEDVVNHGFGNINIEIKEVKTEFKIKILFEAGKSWVYFIEKRTPNYKMENIL